MPSPNTPQSITARPEVPSGQRQVTFNPQERSVDLYKAAPEDPEVMGLITGLKSLNPALEQYVNLQNQKDANAAFKQGTAQGQLSDAGLQDAQGGPIKVPPPPDNLKIDPAFSDTFAAGYRNSVGAKIGNQIQTDILSQYAQNKNADGFDPEQFLHDQVAQHTQGITDPAIVDQVSRSVAATADHVRQDFAQVQLQRLKETAVGNLSAVADSVLAPSKSLDQMWDGVQNQLEPMRGQLGLLTRPEMADMLLDKVSNLSQQAGGRPELFDLFTQYKDPHTGLTLQQMNPKIQTEATRMRARATEEQNQRINQGQQADFFKRTVADEDAASNGQYPSIQDFIGRIGPLNQFHDASSALGEYRRLSNLADAAQQNTQAVQAIGNGTGWALDKKDAQAALDTAQAPDVQTLMQVASGAVSGDPSQIPQVQQAIKSIVDITGRSGRSDIANSKLKALIDGTVNAVPPKDGQPSSQFNLAAALYGGLPDQIRSLYFDEKAVSLFDSFLRDRQSGVDAGTAYQNAYRSISPEALKAAKELASNPEWKAQVAKSVSGLTTDLIQRVWGVGRFFGGAPQSEEPLAKWASVQLTGYYARNPNASPDQAQEWIQQKVQSNFIYDPVNKVDLQVPAGQANENTREAIKAYLEKAREQYGEDASPGLIYNDRTGTYILSAFISGAPIHKLADVSFNQIIQENAYAKVLSPDERAAMAALKTKLNAGTATSQDLIDNAEVIARASTINQINGATRDQINKIRDDAFSSAVSNLVTFPTAPASFAGLSGSRLTGQGSKIQVNQAGNWLGTGNFSAALTAMGEGLVLKATPDPNPKAGNNIGYGYNLNANAANIGEDFRRAGIPADAIEGIKNGTKQITPEQAARLLEVSLPRYEARAKGAVDAVNPNLWAMLSQPQKAALTDVCYQVGDVSQFHKAIGALARNDAQGFQEALKVTYRADDGTRREDVRRNNLRTLMTNGPIAFFQGLKEASRTAR